MQRYFERSDALYPAHTPARVNKGVIIMARVKLIKTKKDSIYKYIDTDGSTKYMYRYKYYDQFNKRREKTRSGFDKIEACERELIKVKAQVLDGNHVILQNDQMTVKVLILRYTEINKNEWKLSTLESHDNAMNNHIIPRLGHYKLKALTNTILKLELIDPLIESGYSENSILSIFRRLNAAYNFALKEEWIDRKRFTTPDVKRAKPSKKRSPLTIEVLEEFLKIVKEEYTLAHYAVVMLLALTGMRAGEARALKWHDDIDFENQYIHINKTRDKLGERSPKTKNSYRTIPMNDKLKEVLIAYKKWYDMKMVTKNHLNQDGYVFISHKGIPIGDLFINRVIKEVCTKYKLPHFTPHYFRHTYASILVSRNIPITTVAALIGDTTEMVYKTYAHSFAQDEIDAATMLNEFITINVDLSTKDE